MIANRIGVIAIIIEGNRKSAEQVNKVLSEHGDCICGRMGVPNKTRDLHVISLIVEATTEQVGALTGRLGNLEGVSVKSVLTNKSYSEEKA